MIDFTEADDFTEQERWAWREACFCQRMARDLRGHIMDGWAAKAAPQHHPDTHRNMYEVSIRGEVWEQMGWHLMQPYHARKEREGHEPANA